MLTTLLESYSLEEELTINKSNLDSFGTIVDEHFKMHTYLFSIFRISRIFLSKFQKYMFLFLIIKIKNKKIGRS